MANRRTAAAAVAAYLDARDRYLALRARQGRAIALGAAAGFDLEAWYAKVSRAFAEAIATFERLWKEYVVRDEDLPRHLRFACLACEDTGVESYRIEGEQPGARPCKHCDRGKIVLMAWQHSEDDELVDDRRRKHRYLNGGPYSTHDIGVGTASHQRVQAWTIAEINAVMALPCHHAEVPGAVKRIARAES